MIQQSDSTFADFCFVGFFTLTIESSEQKAHEIAGNASVGLTIILVKVSECPARDYDVVVVNYVEGDPNAERNEEENEEGATFRRS